MKNHRPQSLRRTYRQIERLGYAIGVKRVDDVCEMIAMKLPDASCIQVVRVAVDGGREGHAAATELLAMCRATQMGADLRWQGFGPGVS